MSRVMRIRLTMATGAVVAALLAAGGVRADSTPSVAPALRVAANLPCSGFAGRWDSNYGPVQIDSEGAAAFGNYNEGAATLQGKIDGNVLAGTYEEGDNKGEFVLELSGDGSSFSGSWDGADGTHGEWTGTCAPPIAG